MIRQRISSMRTSESIREESTKAMKLFSRRTVDKPQMTFTSIICFCVLFGTAASQNFTKAEKKECRDKLPTSHCRLLMENGACQNRIKQMIQLCSRTCEFCDSYCKDFLPFLCPWWEFHKACYTHPHVLNVYCRKSCGKCGRAAAPPKKVPCQLSTYGCCWDMKTAMRPNKKCPECKDANRFCKTFFRYCFYGRNKQSMHKMCPKTCRKCKHLAPSSNL